MNIDIDPYLEQQYNNRKAVPEHPEIIDSWARRSEAWRNQCDAELDIAYGDSAREILDIFPLGSGDELAPVHIFLHGGYWQRGGKDWFSFIAEIFNRRGECAVIVNYDLCPSVTLGKIVEQMQTAIGWVVKNIARYGGDSESIKLTGHSAGGHLAAILLTLDWSELGLSHAPFQQINPLSGLFDLQPLVPTSINRALQLDQATAKTLSPLFMKPWNPSPSLQVNLLVGERESDEFKKQSQQLHEAWKDSIDIQYREIPDRHHFSILDDFF
ncbi:MAG: alpha/beta hydrolase [Proteobacteria bacterium]|nr:alpha/beta hydrolase [Pseudomonadota bacterium]